LQAAAQSALIGVAKADLYPSFALFGSVGVLASSGTNTTKSVQSGAGELFSSDSLFFVGGPQFNWPIFNYGRIKNNVRVQDARLQQAFTNYQNTVLRAAQEAEDSMIAFLRARQEVDFRIKSERAAKRSVDLALIQYREGSVNYNTVLNTQQSLVAQQEQLTNTRGDIVINLVSLYKALGGGWQIRQGKPFIPESVQKEMSERTDWGGIISPKDPPPEEKIGTKRSPDW
jgi:outer membrane protein TolC